MLSPMAQSLFHTPDVLHSPLGEGTLSGVLFPSDPRAGLLSLCLPVSVPSTPQQEFSQCLLKARPPVKNSCDCTQGSS